MVKRLINKLVKGFKKTIFLVTTGFLLQYGCPSNIIEPNSPKPKISPYPNLSPKTELYVTPTSGEALLETKINLDGNDSDGEEDIVEYRLEIDKEKDGIIDETISQSDPINITRTFDTGKVKIYGQCTDSKGLTDKKSIDVIVSNPVLELEETSLNEEVPELINLPLKDKGGYPVTYLGIKDYDKDKLNIPELNNNQLILEGNKDATGDYYLILKFKVNEKEDIATLNGEIRNLPDISGSLESNEERGIGKSGVIKLFGVKYSEPNNSVYIPLEIKKDDSIVKTELSTTSGDFDFQIFTADKTFSEFILQGLTKEGTEWKSYIRTLKLSQSKDYNEKKIRVVPYPNFDTDGDGDIDKTDCERFKMHAIETNTLYLDGLSRFDLKNINGVEIIKYDPLYPDRSFTIEKQEFMKNKILNTTDIRNYIEGKILNVQIDTQENQDSQKHYYIYNNKEIVPEKGWIIIVPEPNLPYAGIVSNYDSNYDGLIEKSKIRLRTVNDAVVTHELGHVFISDGGHAYTLPATLTIMVPSGLKITKPGIADVKMSHIVYEETYPLLENPENILGLKFVNE